MGCLVCFNSMAAHHVQREQNTRTGSAMSPHLGNQLKRAVV